MELIPNETTLVIAGAWNPAILSPDWILRHGLNRTEPEQRVQVTIPAGPNVFDPPRYTLDVLTYVVQPNALVLALTEQSQSNLDLLENVAARTVGELRHTPVTGVGHNFEYREQEPSEGHLAVFTQSTSDIADVIPTGWNSGATSIHSSFKNGDETVFMNIQRKFDGGVLTVKFNFHHPITSHHQLLSVLRGEGYQRMAANLNSADQLVRSLYGVSHDD